MSTSMRLSPLAQDVSDVIEDVFACWVPSAHRNVMIVDAARTIRATVHLDFGGPGTTLCYSWERATLETLCDSFVRQHFIYVCLIDQVMGVIRECV